MIQTERIAEVLPDTSREEYFLAVPDIEQRRQYEQALEEIVRWRGLPPIDPEFTESVLDHVVSTLGDINEIESKYPHLSSETDLIAVRGIIICHDAGETYKGDLNKADRDYTSLESMRIKRGQRLFAQMCIFSRLAAPTRDKVSNWYKEFEKIAGGYPNCSDCTNKEILFARFLDLVNGNRTAQKQFFDLERLPAERRNAEFITKQHRSLPEIADLLEVLGPQLSPETYGNLCDIVIGELVIYAATMRYPEVIVGHEFPL